MNSSLLGFIYRATFVALVLVAPNSPFAALAANRFPTKPDVVLTPGSTCEQKRQKRYPEGIWYCSRNVDRQTKKMIIERYDDERGFSVGEMPRSDFKIDHYIPLCMGGSNDEDNLWPQHKSVYENTDPLEGEICLHMQRGRMLQHEGIDMIKEAKEDPSKAPEMYRKLREGRNS